MARAEHYIVYIPGEMSGPDEVIAYDLTLEDAYALMDRYEDYEPDMCVDNAFNRRLFDRERYLDRDIL